MNPTHNITEPINPHGLICDFGRHRGTPYTQMPVSYLRWMVGCNHSRAAIAQAELDRRGTPLPEIDISGHAIDRASLRVRRTWHESRAEDEGLYSWLVRISTEALERNETDSRGRFLHDKVKLVIELDGRWPVLKTIYPRKGRGCHTG